MSRLWPQIPSLACLRACATVRVRRSAVRGGARRLAGGDGADSGTSARRGLLEAAVAGFTRAAALYADEAARTRAHARREGGGCCCLFSVLSVSRSRLHIRMCAWTG